MKTILSLSIATLLTVSIAGMAATVEYQHPDLTIVAKNEPLDTVLKSLGKEMRIYITVPAGINPLVSCDIQQQPIKQAFKTLLGDMSYSLAWEEKTGQLLGVTILAGGDGVASAKPSHAQSVEQPASVAASVPVAITSGQDTGMPAAPSDPAPPMVEEYAAMVEAREETERAEQEAQMETQRLEYDARMVEQQAVQEERMKQEIARHDAEMEAALASEGLQVPQ
jgi:hypothetical protein